MDITAMKSVNSSGNLEARVGIEPTHKGFADLELPRLTSFLSFQKQHSSTRLSDSRPTSAREGGE